MKHLIITICIYTSHSSFCQIQNLNQNNINATINSSGIFFNKQDIYVAGYEFPSGSNTHTIYSAAFWFAAKDNLGNLHVAAQKYSSNQDVFSGPISTNYTDNNYIDTYNDKIWIVTNNEIQTHISSYTQPSYTIPNSILNWPANGNSAIGVANDLAPYIDKNFNGIYDPENGDYPNIRGDKALYIILNDDGVHTESNGVPLKMEFHYMIYQYSDNTIINNTTFIHLKVINRSLNTYEDFKVGFFVDPDIGGSSDDFVGCDSMKNLIFAYNGDLVDDGTGGVTYGLNAPALGVKLLNAPLDVFAAYHASSSAPTIQPQTAADYWGYLNAEFGASTNHFTFGGTGLGGTTNTNFLYSGNPSNSGEWSEISAGNPPQDISMMGGTKGISIAPNESICFDYAIFNNRNGNNPTENVSGLYNLADEIQDYYDNQQYYTCDNITLGFPNYELDQSIRIIPNPSNGNFQIITTSIFNVDIYTVNGELVYSKQNLSSFDIIQSNLISGIYLVKINTSNSIINKKLIIN